MDWINRYILIKVKVQIIFENVEAHTKMKNQVEFDQKLKQDTSIFNGSILQITT